MSVRIRLRRMGAKKRPFYRIVVADSRKPRGGRYIENLGHYDPMKDPPDIEIKEERLFGWLKNGAQPSPPVKNLLSRMGLSEKWALLKRGEDVSQFEVRLKVKEKKKKPRKPPSKEEKPVEVAAVAAKEAKKAAEPQEGKAVEEEKKVAGPKKVKAAKKEKEVPKPQKVKEEEVVKEKAAAVQKPKKPRAKKEAGKPAAGPAGSGDKKKAAAKKPPARKRSSTKASEKKSTKKKT